MTGLGKYENNTGGKKLKINLPRYGKGPIFLYWAFAVPFYFISSAALRLTFFDTGTDFVSTYWTEFLVIDINRAFTVRTGIRCG